ncbi:transposase [Streptomyces sp. NPDC057579]|uniref:transposase n=1 Tax=Streptomyces sp. NPDC057579 TaxID=3346172 RepID=UPI00369A7F66
MGSGRWGWIVPEGIWEIVRPLLPPARVRPQGGGIANIDDEAVFAAIIYVLVSGCAWRALLRRLATARTGAVAGRTGGHTCWGSAEPMGSAGGAPGAVARVAAETASVIATLRASAMMPTLRSLTA